MARQWQQWQQWQWWGGDTWSWTTSRSWQDSASRRHAVGVYFGTFDPIHENHIGLCKYALTQGVVQMVYLVVNGDNPMKPLAVSYEERLRLVRRRVELEVDDRIRLMELSGEEAGRMRWLDRQDICERARYLVEAGGNAEVYQLLGQDSFEQAVGRSRPKGKGKGKGIFSTSTRFLVFPRAGSDESVHIPPDMRRRVAVVKDYVDPVTLSSTQIRAAAAEGHDLQGSVHPGILEDVIATYTRTRRFLVLLFGPPGSGKTALGRELERAFGFYHISGGDAYRAAKSRGLFGAYREDDRKQTVAKVFAAVARAAAVLAPAPVSFDGFLPKELPDFEAKVGTPGLIIKLDCPAEVLQQRLQERGQREHDVDLSVSQRMRSHYSQDKALPEFHQCLRVLRSDRPLQDVAGDLAGLVREAAARHRLSLEGVSLEDTGRQIIDEDFWHRIFQEIESSPAESYNLRPNASTMKERQGSRGLKNFNNLVKDVLICWAVQQVAAPASAVHVLDVASGRGGDQMKFGKAAAAANRRLCYTAIDVAEAQILEAQRRMIASRQKDDAPSLESARFLIGDVAKIAPSTFAQQLALQHISSVQFAVHYAFSSCESARTFLRNATGRLRQGGLLLITTVDSCAMGRLARDAKDLVWQNGLLRVTFSDLQTLERIADEKEEYGLRYRFDLTGEGIDCEEFVVPEALMRGLLQELQVEVLAAMPFSDIALEDNLTAEQIATSILSRLPAGQASDVSVYDRLGLLLSREEAAIAALYKLFVCRKRQEPALTPEDAEEPSSHQAGDLLKGEPPVHVQ
ncbi:unnamed protein product [Effrenium voratum]|uniref:mRNA (guanine-N(7))-methyltransferase n=1 Tax=Effrenium voratum TaxID=2562239 RepID=A0AA36I9L5_9DINO|nr:unnamed protein product [Effrenium voratum]